ncbi:hypothetical protein [Pseudodesulfovibrio sp. zrk46]|uniref:hypothetical protein n=1 Tax=Pseudodesulfovibrio sp. zrk46 TaxID=2725288 RepID=UPI00144925A8|nr:hypothetical protein [Pseudodesulfovibrio sp. zrk46]QJB56411.1 hypothetical protein HFN16_08280 [Pseudodesulfovibrio sp. zrk46]
MPRLGKFVFSFVLFVIVCYGGLVWFVNHEVEKGFNEAVAGVDGLKVAYDDIWVSITDQTVTLTAVDATLPDGQQMAAKEIVVHAFDERNPVPHFIRAQVKGMQYAPTQMGGALALGSAMFGLERLNGDMYVDYRYDTNANSLTLNNFSFDDQKIGKLELSGTMTDLDLDQFRMEKLVGLRIANAELTFMNRSFFSTFMQRAAETMRIPEAQATEELISELNKQAQMAGNSDNKVAENALLGLKDFVADPGSIVISATPAEPVPYLYLFMGRDVYENMRLMNLTVKAAPAQGVQ